ncbi:MAG: Sensor histidine kinase RcsC [Phycisphaerae bacterium]|nr:Sensor histidine kinase RcsC [Phycisphaerae bacterium]
MIGRARRGAQSGHAESASLGGAAAAAGTDETDADIAARNAAILNSSLDGFFILDESYTLLEFNAAFARMLGYPRDALLGQKLSQLEIETPGHAGVERTNAARTGHHLFFTAMRHRLGHAVELEVSVMALHSGPRKVLVGFARDVTERLRAERALCESEQRLRGVIRGAPIALLATDAQGRVTLAEGNIDGAAFIGRGGAMNGQPALEALRSYPELCAALRRGLAGESFACVIAIAQRTCEWTFAPQRGEAGEQIGLIAVATDVTERIRAEEQRRQLEQQVLYAQKLESLGVMAGGVAHDFNNFLVGVLCNASLALESLPVDSPVRGQIEKILNASKRASELTRQMLVYSGRGNIEVRSLVLNDLIREMSELLRAAFPRQVELRLNLDPSLPTIDADAGQMQQLIMNLLINASEAIGEHPGTVSCTTYASDVTEAQRAVHASGDVLPAGRYVCLEVSDNGCGMSAETQARIFEPFFTTKFTGRGLGLAAILGIVRSHHGTIRVASQPGVGTVFTVMLPVAQQPAAAPVRPPVERSARQGGTVLVIDDEEDVRDVVQAVLARRGFRVLAADDGPSGIDLFRRHAAEIDLVLLDLTMPEMSGEEVMQHIAAIRPDAKIVLSSGYSEDETYERLSGERPPAGFVQKPYTVDALIDKVAALIG